MAILCLVVKVTLPGRPGGARIAQANVLKESKGRSKATVLVADAYLVCSI